MREQPDYRSIAVALREDLAAAQAKIEQLKNDPNNCFNRWQRAVEEIATQALQIKELREALEAVQQVSYNSDGIVGWHLNGETATWDEVLPEVDEALSKTYSDEALRKFVAGEIRKLDDGHWQEGDHYSFSELASMYEKGLV